MNEFSDKHENVEIAYEHSDVNMKKLFFAGFVIVAILSIIVIVLNELFISSAESEFYSLVYKPVSKELRELRAKETETLNTYKSIDSEKGIYQIPIDRAMELMADEAFQKRLQK